MNYRFEARSKSGKRVGYYLNLKLGTGPANTSNWLPAVNESVPLSFENWEMAKGSGGKTGACLTDGVVPFPPTTTTTVTVTNTGPV